MNNFSLNMTQNRPLILIRLLVRDRKIYFLLMLLLKCSNLGEIEKINKLASVLDKHREVSIQECIYRILGLPMTKFSVKVKYFLNFSY